MLLSFPSCCNCFKHRRLHFCRAVDHSIFYIFILIHHNGWITLRRAPDQEGEAIVELTASTGTGVDIVRHYRVTVLAPARPWLRGWRIGLMATSTVAAATSTAERLSSE